MKLYITAGSPYARIARIFILEKGMQDRIEIVLAQTRKADSPYYQINPSGRVPYLMRDDGVGLEESALIVDYLDQLDGKPTLGLPTGDQQWEARRLEGVGEKHVGRARSLGPRDHAAAKRAITDGHPTRTRSQ